MDNQIKLASGQFWTSKDGKEVRHKLLLLPDDKVLFLDWRGLSRGCSVDDFLEWVIATDAHGLAKLDTV